MTAIPYSHIVDAHKLDADGKIELFELSPSLGSGTLRFKNDNTTTWRGLTYSGLPMKMDGETSNSTGISPQPTLIIGQTDIDLSQFKPLIWSGGLDNARIVRYKVLVDNLVNNRDIKEVSIFRVKRVENYSSSEIKLVLSVFSPTGPATIPFRQYTPPDFPFVSL